jgi:hypothetical protein
MWRCFALAVVIACGPPARDHNDAATGGGGQDGAHDDSSTGGGGDGGAGDGGGNTDGGGGGNDGGGGTSDGGIVVTPDAAMPGVITGGPCASGAQGATAYRVRWANSNGTAYVVYEVHGLPDKSRNKAGAYGYQIGFTPSYVDPFLAQGGLQLNSSSFVDLELSTVGLATLSKATLSIYGRSYNTTASGSFNWQTFEDTGSTPTNSVSNVAPYAWYAGDMTSAISAGKNNVLIRVKAGPNSGALVVNKIELCVVAT